MNYRMKKLIAFLMALLMVFQLVPATSFASTIDVDYKNKEDGFEPNMFVSINLADNIDIPQTKKYFVAAGTVAAGFDAISFDTVKDLGNGVYGFYVENVNPNDMIIVIKYFDENDNNASNHYNDGNDAKDMYRGIVPVGTHTATWSTDIENGAYHAALGIIRLEDGNKLGSATVTKNATVQPTSSDAFGLKINIDEAGLYIPSGNNIYVAVKVVHIDKQNNQKTNFAVWHASVDDAQAGEFIVKSNQFIKDEDGNIWLTENGGAYDSSVSIMEDQIQSVSLYMIARADGAACEGNLAHLIGQGIGVHEKSYVLISDGQDLSGYTVGFGNSMNLLKTDSNGNYYGPTLSFTKVPDGEGISKPTIDSYIRTAIGFGLYTVELAEHSTDMEANIAAEKVTGFGKADFGFSDNNIYINNIKFIKKYADNQGNTIDKPVKFKLYKVVTNDKGEPIREGGKLKLEEAKFTFESPGDNTNGQQTQGHTETVDNLISGNTVNGIFEGTFARLPNGKYVIKEVMDDNVTEVYFESGKNNTYTYGTGNDAVTVKFIDGIIEINNPYNSKNYFGEIADGVSYQNIVDSSRHSLIHVADEDDYKEMKKANGNVDDNKSKSILHHATGNEVMDISSDMENLVELSEKLATAGSSDTVQVITVRASQIQESINIIETNNRYVVVNVIMDSNGSFNPQTSFNGRILQADFGQGGREDSSKVLYNLITEDPITKERTPYAGTATTAKAGSGVLLCPAGTVGHLSGNWGGTIICAVARHSGSEIHSDNANKIISKNTMITNTKGDTNTGNLIIEKEIAGDQENRTLYFTFEIELKNGTEPVTGTFVAAGLPNGRNTVRFNSEGKATVQVRANNRLIISDLPAGAEYTIKEVTTSATSHYEFKEFNVTGHPGAIKEKSVHGTITKNNEVKIKAVNEAKKAGLQIQKVVSNSSNNDVEFEFDLYLWKEEIKNNEVEYHDLGAGEKKFNSTQGELIFKGGPENKYTNLNNITHAASKCTTTIKLNNTESIYISNIEEGVHFAFVEKEPLPDGYSFGERNLQGVITGTVSDLTYEFENRLDNGGLKIRKNVTENGSVTLSDEAKNILKGDYIFTIYKDENCSEAYPDNENPTTVTITIDDSGETVTSDEVTDLPAGVYWIEETSSNNNKVKPVQSKVSVEVKAGQTADQALAIAEFTNNYAHTQAVLSAKKAANANLNESKKFQFQLLDADDNDKVLQTSTAVGQGQTATFEAIAYTLADLGGETSKTYNYKIKEVIPSDAETVDGKKVKDGVTYDEHIEEVAVVVTNDGNGNLTVTYNGQTSFTTPEWSNTYAAKGSVTFNAKKIFKNGDLSEHKFNIKITQIKEPAEGKDYELVDKGYTDSKEVNSGSEQTVTFDGMPEFVKNADGNDEGTYWFLIEEELPTGVDETNKILDHVQYDTQKALIKVTVTDNGEGKLIVEKTKDGKIIKDTDLDVTFTNEQLGSLKIKKEVTLNGAGTKTDLVDGTYTFTVISQATHKEVNGETEVNTPDTIKKVTITIDGGIATAATIDNAVAEIDKDGYVLVKDLRAGDYTVTEDTKDLAKKGITLISEGTQTVKVTNNRAESIKAAEFTNNRTYVQVSKVDAANSEELKGATIQVLRKLVDGETTDGLKIIDKDGKKYVVVDEWVSTDKAHVVENLTVDQTYILHEEVAPAGYLITSDTTFSIDQTGKVTATGSTTTDENGNEVLLIKDNKTHIEVSKVDIADGEELSGATIQILRKLDENEAKSDEKTYVTINEVEYEVVEEWVSEKDKTHVVEGLLTGTEYILHETVAPEGYDITADTTFSIDENGNVTGSATINESGVLLVEDTMLTVQKAVKKVWDDDENRDGVRPISLTVTLTASYTDENGKLVEYPAATKTLDQTNGWSGLVKNLPTVYSKSQCLISYTWKEGNFINDDKYMLTQSTSGDGVLTTLTNTHDVEKTEVSVKKVWDDSDNAAKKRPKTIKVQLFANGKLADVKDAVVTLGTDETGWTYTWKNLKKNENGQPIVYSVDELEVPEGYIKTVTPDAGANVTSYTITNTLDLGKLILEKKFELESPEGNDKTKVPVVKIWDDNYDRYGNRPTSVTVHLYADGTEVDKVELHAGNNWKYTFTDLPRWRDEKRTERIEYTISEDPVRWYRAEINGYNIRNIYTPELTSATVRKVWQDQDNIAGMRPTSIAMTLSDGTRVLLNEENGWTATVTGLQKYINGQEAVYTWSEQEVVGYVPWGEPAVTGSDATFTNHFVNVPPIPKNMPKAKVPGNLWFIFEEYETALGGEILINHVGDCFD